MSDKNETWFESEGAPQSTHSDEDMENDNSTDLSSGGESHKTNDHQDETPQSEEDNKQTEEEKSDGEVSDSEDENKDSEENDGEDKLGDFAKHPAWQKREKVWKERYNEQEKKHSDEIAKIWERIGESKNPEEEQEAPTEVPDWFGGDEKQWKDFVKYNETLVSKAKEDAKNEILAQKTEEQKKIEEATTYMNEQIAEIEAETGDKVDKNRLLKITLENELIDTKGRWNYKAAHKIMRAEQNKSPNDRNKKIESKKELANATDSKPSSDPAKRNFKTPEDFETNRPW